MLVRCTRDVLRYAGHLYRGSPTTDKQRESGNRGSRVFFVQRKSRFVVVIVTEIVNDGIALIFLRGYREEAAFFANRSLFSNGARRKEIVYYGNTSINAGDTFVRSEVVGWTALNEVMLARRDKETRGWSFSFVGD